MGSMTPTGGGSGSPPQARSIIASFKRRTPVPRPDYRTSAAVGESARMRPAIDQPENGCTHVRQSTRVRGLT
jgi:hypothetical protein